MIRWIGIAAATAAWMAGMAEGTSVAVLEFGKAGAARRTTTESSLTSAGAVGSFWSSLHTGVKTEGKPRRFSKQHPGMTIVPDLFQRPDGGFAIGISGSGVELSSMPFVSGLLLTPDDESSDAPLGHFYMNGDVTETLMDKASAGDKVSSSTFKTAAVPKMNVVMSKESGNTLEAVHVEIEDRQQAADLDAQVAELLAVLAKQANESGSTIMVHIVIDEKDDETRRALVSEEEPPQQVEEETSRRLNEDNNKDGENDDNNNSEVKYKTIFQIQYFQLVLWTAIGLVLILFSSVVIFMGMPLMPDTLLFGESAKMMGE